MKSLLLVAACAALAGLVCAGSVKDREGYLYQHRERLGHFKEQPFIDLYKTYAAAFVLPYNKEIRNDDYRSYTPSLDQCMVFLEKYRKDKYRLTAIQEFVKLDACLGYLYESEYHELDQSESEMGQRGLEKMIGDERLAEQYKGTTVDKLESGAQDCIANLLMSAVIMRNQYKEQRCNSHWIQLFLQFAACHHEIPQELRQSDTYVQPLYQLVRDETHACFEAERLAIEEAVRDFYRRSYGTRVKNSFSGMLSGRTFSKQQGERMWPSAIIKLLSTVQGAKREISLREVHGLLRGFYLGEKKLTGRLLRNMATYATQTIKPTMKDKAGDVDGSLRYEERVVDDLCNFFRSADTEKYFDFATSYVRLVQLLSHEDVFDISPKAFMKALLTHTEDSAAMYLSISACNVLTFTEGHIVAPARGKKIEYEVTPKADTTDMVVWPDAGFY